MFRLLRFLLLPVAAIFCYTYDFVLQKEDIFDKCKYDPDNSLDKYVNMENVKYTYITDEVIIINGDWIFIWDFEATDRIDLFTEMMKFDRGMWVPTVFTIKRDDFCKTAFSPNELWFDFAKLIPKEQQKCPPPKGSKFTFSNVTLEVRFRWMPDPYMEGQYKIVGKHSVKNKNGEEKFKICYEILYQLYRV